MFKTTFLAWILAWSPFATWSDEQLKALLSRSIEVRAEAVAESNATPSEKLAEEMEDWFEALLMVLKGAGGEPTICIDPNAPVCSCQEQGHDWSNEIQQPPLLNDNCV